MTDQNYEVVKPEVSYSMYWPEALLLLLSVATPVIAWFIWRNGNMLGRSGSVMVFFAAVAEFVSIHRMNKKHILNACRVRANEIPWEFSSLSTVVGVISLIFGLVGTLLWGYGDMLIGCP
jgi:hypothetical protein